MKEQLTQERMEALLRDATIRIAEKYRGTINEWFCPSYVSCDLEARTFTCAFTMKPEFANPHGVAHGGAVATVLDNAMGYLAFLFSGHASPTISMTVSYLRGVPTERTIHIRTRLDKPGSTVHYLSAEAYLPEAPDRPLATAIGSYLAAEK